MAGNLITGDALYCQRDYCQQVLAAGGDYLVTVKKNQRELHEANALAFARPVWGAKYRKAHLSGLEPVSESRSVRDFIKARTSPKHEHPQFLSGFRLLVLV